MIPLTSTQFKFCEEKRIHKILEAKISIAGIMADLQLPAQAVANKGQCITLVLYRYGANLLISEKGL